MKDLGIRFYTQTVCGIELLLGDRLTRRDLVIPEWEFKCTKEKYSYGGIKRWTVKGYLYITIKPEIWSQIKTKFEKSYWINSCEKKTITTEIDYNLSSTRFEIPDAFHTKERYKLEKKKTIRSLKAKMRSAKFINNLSNSIQNFIDHTNGYIFDANDGQIYNAISQLVTDTIIKQFPNFTQPDTQIFKDLFPYIKDLKDVRDNIDTDAISDHFKTYFDVLMKKLKTEITDFKTKRKAETVTNAGCNDTAK